MEPLVVPPVECCVPRTDRGGWTLGIADHQILFMIVV